MKLFGIGSGSLSNCALPWAVLNTIPVKKSPTPIVLTMTDPSFHVD
jgi:hypothetical protein